MNRFKTMNDSQLMSLFYQGNHAAFDEIARRWLPDLTTWAVQFLMRRYRVHRHAAEIQAEEGVQEVFAKLLRNRDRETARWQTHCGELGPWLRAVVANQLRDLARKNRRRARQLKMSQQPANDHDSLADQADHRTPAAEELAVKDELEHVLEVAINRLRPRQQQILRRHYFAQCSQSEIACSLNLSNATVSNEKAEALRELRETLMELAC